MRNDNISSFDAQSITCFPVETGRERVTAGVKISILIQLLTNELTQSRRDESP